MKRIYHESKRVNRHQIEVDVFARDLDCEAEKELFGFPSLVHICERHEQYERDEDPKITRNEWIPLRHQFTEYSEAEAIRAGIEYMDEAEFSAHEALKASIETKKEGDPCQNTHGERSDHSPIKTD